MNNQFPNRKYGGDIPSFLVNNNALVFDHVLLRDEASALFKANGGMPISLVGAKFKHSDVENTGLDAMVYVLVTASRHYVKIVVDNVTGVKTLASFHPVNK